MLVRMVCPFCLDEKENRVHPPELCPKQLTWAQKARENTKRNIRVKDVLTLGITWWLRNRTRLLTVDEMAAQHDDNLPFMG